jgi:predicted nucleic acid-binding Zn ribbon protein
VRSTGEILNGAIKKLGLESKIKSHQIWYIWDKEVGHHIANVAQPEDVKGKTLFVNVKDNIWLRQLKFLESMIIDKLNSAIGENVINKIYFKLGEIKQSTVASQQLPVSEQITYDRQPLTDIDLPSIKDADLKKTIQRIISKANTIKRT